MDALKNAEQLVAPRRVHKSALDAAASGGSMAFSIGDVVDAVRACAPVRWCTVSALTISLQDGDRIRRIARPVVPLALVFTVAAWWPAATAQQPTFATWLEKVRSDAVAAGISSVTVNAALAGLEPLEEVIERDRNQAEFTMDFRTYLARVASQSRVEEGQRVLATYDALLRDVGSRYGMPPELLAAVWGVESNFGRGQGDYSVV